ncbi:MAG: uncharacterized protein QOF14_3673 [Hyphomicrobiales bacterium]|jgi:uncharacterized protein (UPF0276 family)|nr:uncharacterized protein [Hyphomicrobiales bacterium]
MGNTNVAAASGAAARFDALPSLGIGLAYNPSLPEYLRERRDTFDYIEITPELFWMDAGRGAQPRYTELSGWVGMLDRLAAACPIVSHSLGYSLGSADFFDETYSEHIAAWQRRYAFPWHSDHLSFVRLTGAEGHDHNAGLAVPVPYDRDVLDMIATRIRSILATVPIPFLIENNVYFIDVPDQDMTEPQFLTSLARETGCGILLDLHNLYTNARNHRFDTFAWLDELDLEHVVEVHIAGGGEIGGMYTDSHSGPCPQPVWDLLAHVVPRAPSLRGITFEFHDSYYPLMKADGVAAELGRARSIWERRVRS